MKIKSITLSNFRCFENLEIELNDNLTVIVGNNGAGKSSILDAISIAIGTFLAGLDGVYSIGINKEDARYKFYDMGSVIDVQPQFPVIISAQGSVNEKSVTWKRELSSSTGRTRMVDAKEMLSQSKEYQKRISAGDKDLILPILSYYGTGRLWAQKREKSTNEQLYKFSRLIGYTDCLAAESNEKLMLKWFEKMTIQEAQNRTVSPEFLAVKQAMVKCFWEITGYSNVDVLFNLDTHNIDICYEDHAGAHLRFPMMTLSDGYKSTLCLVADIAYRMAILNPQLLGDVTQKTGGIILIDEIDLHLHPLWQQRIIKDLTNIFPLVQFVVSTHSPTIISSVCKDNLLILENCNSATYSGVEVYGSDSNSVLEVVMGANERPVEIKDLFSRFYDLVEEESWEQAEEMLNSIEEKIGSSDPELNSARITLRLDQA